MLKFTTYLSQARLDEVILRFRYNDLAATFESLCLHKVLGISVDISAMAGVIWISKN